MTQHHLMMRHFSRINKSTSCLTSTFQKTFIRLLKDFGPQCLTGKIYNCHLFFQRIVWLARLLSIKRLSAASVPVIFSSLPCEFEGRQKHIATCNAILTWAAVIDEQ